MAINAKRWNTNPLYTLAILKKIFGLNPKNRNTLLAFAILVGAYIYFIWAPVIIRYKDFGIVIPNGYQVHGIDVSHYQGNINWREVEQMKSHNMSLSFAIIKATEGTNLTDNQFKKNWKKIKSTKMIRGAYHFFRANSDGKTQALYYLSHVKLDKGDLPPVLDVEPQGNIKFTKKHFAEIKEWLTTVERRTGMKPIIYSNSDFLNKTLTDSAFQRYPIWIAHYNHPSGPRTDREWIIWQHSESGRVNSIKDPVDFNVYNGSIDELRALCKK